MNKKDKKDISLKDIIGELEQVAFHKLSDFVEADDEGLDIKDFNYSDASVKTLEYSNGKLKIQFYDKLKALDLLGKMISKEDNLSENEDKSIIVNFKGISNYKNNK